MVSVTLTVRDINSDHGRDVLIVNARCFSGGRMRYTQMWAFPLPVHESDLFDRAYLTWPGARVYLQENMLLPADRFGSWY